MTASKLVAVDVGGTFTDVVAIENGDVRVSKVPTDVSANDISVLAGAADVGVADARVFNVASTAGLNAIITRRLPKQILEEPAIPRISYDAGSYRVLEAHAHVHAHHAKRVLLLHDHPPNSHHIRETS